MRELPVHHAERARDARRLGACDAQHVDRGADGGERRAELVRERREELVLAAVRLAERALGGAAHDVTSRATVVTPTAAPASTMGSTISSNVRLLPSNVSSASTRWREALASMPGA